MRTHRLLLTIFPAIGAFAGQPEALIPEQVKLIEVHSCRLWHDRGIAGIRAEDTSGGGLRASVECEPHAQARAYPLRALAVCEQKQGTWTCEDAGQQLDMDIYGTVRQVQLLDVTPEAALDALDFVKSETDKGQKFRKSLFDGYITVLGSEDSPDLLVTVRDAEREWGFHVNVDCGKGKCRYRISDYSSWQTWDES
jgi:hypothetical protein